ncbi:MAG: DUF4412 domain-containing protein, partial [Rhizobacter sp.]|nr:DUF4412 domain-containing protein [Chlorobiales bacterium]
MMIHLARTFLLILLCVPPTTQQTRSPSASFEGVIDLKITSPRFTGVMTLSLSPLGTRLDLKGKDELNVSFLSLPNDSLAYSLMHGSKTYSVSNLAAARRSISALNATAVYKIEKLGKEKIGLYVCEHFTVQSGRKSVGADMEL